MDGNRIIKEKVLEEVNNYISSYEFEKAIKILENIKGYFQGDPDIFSLLAKLYNIKKEYQKCYDTLIEQKLASFPIFRQLSALYIKIKEYDKLYELYNLYHNLVAKNECNSKEEYIERKIFLRRLQIFLRQYHKEIPLPKNLSYKESIYAQYDHKLALEHIIARHTKNKRHYDNPSTFNENIDIEKLFLIVSRSILLENKYQNLKNTFSDIYLFYYNEVGETNGIKTNLFEIATIPNTNKIITMYPTQYKKQPFFIITPALQQLEHSQSKNGKNNIKFKVKNYKPQITINMRS